MITTIRIIKLIIKFLLFIGLLPLIILWVFIKSQIFKASLRKNLIASGMPKSDANDLAKDVSISQIVKYNYK